jgi:hypothetical protein
LSRATLESRNRWLFPERGVSWKRIQRGGLSILITAALVLPLMAPAGAILGDQAESYGSHPITLVNNLPEQTVSMLFDSCQLGTRINVSITFGLKNRFTQPVTFGVGAFGQPLRVENGRLASAVVGIGYLELREYPFLYVNGSARFDFWKDKVPSWSSRRDRVVWTQDTGAFGVYNGVLEGENISLVDFAGDVFEFENLTVFFRDGSSSVLGLKLITVGMNFTHLEDGWIGHTMFSSSGNDTRVDNEYVYEITSFTRVPLNYPVVVLTMGIGIILAVVILDEMKQQKKYSF